LAAAALCPLTWRWVKPCQLHRTFYDVCSCACRNRTRSLLKHMCFCKLLPLLLLLRAHGIALGMICVLPLVPTYVSSLCTRRTTAFQGAFLRHLMIAGPGRT
jgi:hypothetical protein